LPPASTRPRAQSTGSADPPSVWTWLRDRPQDHTRGSATYRALFEPCRAPSLALPGPQTSAGLAMEAGPRAAGGGWGVSWASTTSFPVSVLIGLPEHRLFDAPRLQGAQTTLLNQIFQHGNQLGGAQRLIVQGGQGRPPVVERRAIHHGRAHG